MRIATIAGICLAGLAMALGYPTPAKALYGCFCSKHNEADRICGEILKFDRDSIIVIKPVAKGRRTLQPVEFAECRAQEPEPPPPKECPSGQTMHNGACVLLNPGTADERFGIAGSNTIGEQLMPALIRAYGRQQGLKPEGDTCADTTIRLRKDAWTLSIACSSHGSGTGIPALAAGRADIAMLSRPINAGEQAAMRRAGYPEMDTVRHETVLALDGLLILVAPQNRVRALTIDQIARAFAGEIIDWAQLGGAPGKINLYVRDTKSGTRDSFEAMVMAPHGKAISRAALNFESSTELSDRVAADPRGLGFVGFAYRGRAKALSMAQPCGIAHAPSALAIRTEDYPLSRRLFLYTAGQRSIHSANLVDFALSAQAQPVIEEAGYVNQTIAAWSARDTQARVSDYVADPVEEPGLDSDPAVLAGLLRTSLQARRLSISFRFRTNSAKLDSKALQDVLRLADFMKAEGRGRRVLLLGFADSRGSHASNLRLSQARADEVRTSLLSSGAGLSPDLIDAQGYSEVMPVACNATATGRAKNRRVEVWLE